MPRPPDPEDVSDPPGMDPSGHPPGSHANQNATGPLGMQDDDPEGWEWHYYFKKNAVLDEQQYELVAAIGNLASILRQLPRTSVSIQIMKRIKGTFSATLVQSFSGDLKRIREQLDADENEIFSRIATTEHQNALKKPVRLTVMTAVVIGILSFCCFLFDTLTPLGTSIPHLATVNTLLLVMIGCLFGRILYYGISYSEKIKSIGAYLDKEGEIRHVEMAIFFDLAVGIAACLVFITGIVVIAFGGDQDATTGSVRAAITSLMIKDNPLLALVFGVLVGIAKTEFLQRLGRLGKSGVA